MRSKNASPNRQSVLAAANGELAAPSPSPATITTERRDSKKSSSPSMNGGGGGGQRRGTQCSITLLDEFESRQQQNRAGSLPFENLIRPQTLAIPGEQVGGETAAATAGTEVRDPQSTVFTLIKQHVYLQYL